MDHLQNSMTAKRNFLQPTLLILFLITTTSSISSTIAYMVVLKSLVKNLPQSSIFVFSDSVLFRILSRVLSNMVVFKFFSDKALVRFLFRIPFMVLSDRVVFGVFSDKVIFNVLGPWIVSRILTPRFLLCYPQ